MKVLDVCREEKRQLHDRLNVMTRSMSKSKKADIPAIYPLKGEHKKPEHVKPPLVVEQEVEKPIEQDKIIDEVELPILQEIPEQVMPEKVQ